MYSFYGGQKGQDFKITHIFSNRSEDMLHDLQARWFSPVNVGDYVFINYGDISEPELIINKNGITTDQNGNTIEYKENHYTHNLEVDLLNCGRSYSNSLWQKIYIDENKNISPLIPTSESENNVFVFINYEDSWKPVYRLGEDGKPEKDDEGNYIIEKYIDKTTFKEVDSHGNFKDENGNIIQAGQQSGNSLKDTNLIYSEENYGFGYRLIACINGQTPRIQVYHETIGIEDGDPYVTLDLTNLEKPKIKFYLQEAQTIQDVISRIVLPPVKNPEVELIKDGQITINGKLYDATLTHPILQFALPRAVRYFSGFLFGQGDLSDYPYTMATEDWWSSNQRFTLYAIQAYLTEQLGYLIKIASEFDDTKENFWSIDSNKFREEIKSILLSEDSDFSYLLPYFQTNEEGLLGFLKEAKNINSSEEELLALDSVPWGSYGLNKNNIYDLKLSEYLTYMSEELERIADAMDSFLQYNTPYKKATFKNQINISKEISVQFNNSDKVISFSDFRNIEDAETGKITSIQGLEHFKFYNEPFTVDGYKKLKVNENSEVEYDESTKRTFVIELGKDNLSDLSGYYFDLNVDTSRSNTVYIYNKLNDLPIIKDENNIEIGYDYTNALVQAKQYFYEVQDYNFEGLEINTYEISTPTISNYTINEENIIENLEITYSGNIRLTNKDSISKIVAIEPIIIKIDNLKIPFKEYENIDIEIVNTKLFTEHELDIVNKIVNIDLLIEGNVIVKNNQLDINQEDWGDYGLISSDQFYSLYTLDEQKQYCNNYLDGLKKQYSIVLLSDILKLISPVMDFKQTLIDIYNNEGIYYFKETHGKYFNEIITMLTYYGYHLMAVIQDAMPGDIYIHTPSGRIYQISEVKNGNTFNEKYITGRYVGALTAPAPEIDMQLQPSFIKTEDGGYKLNQIEIKDNILISSNALGYKEKFTFETPKTPEWKTTYTDVNHRTKPSVDLSVDENQENPDDGIFSVNFKLPRTPKHTQDFTEVNYQTKPSFILEERLDVENEDGSIDDYIDARIKLPRVPEFTIKETVVDYQTNPSVKIESIRLDVTNQDGSIDDYIDLNFSLPREPEWDTTLEKTINTISPSVTERSEIGVDKDTIYLDFTLPRPIHMYTDNNPDGLPSCITGFNTSGLGTPITTITNSTDELSQGDIYLYTAYDKETNTFNVLDKLRGYVYIYNGDGTWTRQGSLLGPIGVPTITKTITFLRDETLTSGEVVRESDILERYSWEDTIDSILSQFEELRAANGDSVPDSQYGEAYVFQSQAVNGDGTLLIEESWWGQYFEGQWSASLVTGQTVLLDEYTENPSAIQTNTYTARYINEVVPYWDTDNYY